MVEENKLLPVVLNNKMQQYKKKKMKYILIPAFIIIAVAAVIFNLNFRERTFVFSEFEKLEDTNPPQIILKGNEIQNICPQEEYVEEGYTAIDKEDGFITDKVIITKQRDKNLEYISYIVYDEYGNLGYITRVIDYKDYYAPSIKIVGRKHEKLISGSNYIDRAPILWDNKDSSKILYSYLKKENINNNITYTLKDSTGNETFETKKIEILDNTKKDKPIIYLTFDDGPCAYTERLLDILKANDVRATFFISGNMERYNYILKRMKQENHSIALHSYSHIYRQIYSSENAFINDLNTVSDLVYSYTKIRPKLFRFAGGSSNTVSKRYNKNIMTRLDRVTKELGYVYTDWNVDSMDTSRGITSENIKWNVINGISNKQYSIVLQHDIHLNSVNAVDSVIKEAKARGYTFDVLDENSPIYQQKIAN